MQTLQPLPYQGSKRYIADLILRYFPSHADSLVEPFAGSAAVSIAADAKGKCSSFHLNDINEPLMALWRDIVNDPEGIANRYERLWHEQRGREREFYDEVRERFNRTHATDSLLYLLARCVKGSVRYNTEGQFNQSPDNRRSGRHPERMRADLVAVSCLFQERIRITARDYREILAQVNSNDLVYMDPPYQGVCTGRDARYYQSVSADEFTFELVKLSRRGISFIVSYDGRLGDKTYGQPLPAEIGAHRLEIIVGRSSQATLLGQNSITYESLYLSDALLAQLELQPDTVGAHLSTQKMQQVRLF